jgi:superfamily II DNA/RNA helicase
MLFSATIPKWMKDLSAKYLKADRKHINLINLAES